MPIWELTKINAIQPLRIYGGIFSSHSHLLMTSSCTYMSLFIKLVVSELEFVEVDNHVHPVRTERWGVRVHVGTRRRTFFFETANPGRVLVLVAVLVYGNHVHVKSVGLVWVQVKKLNLERREHSPVGAWLERKRRGWVR